MIDAFAYVAISRDSVSRYPDFGKEWASSWRTDDGGAWFFSHSMKSDGRCELRFRSGFDRYCERVDDPRYAWMDVGVEGRTGTLRVRTDFSSSIPSFVWNDGETVIVSTSLSETVSVMKSLRISVELDCSAAYAFLVSNFTPAGSTLVKGVSRLPANSDVSFNPSGGVGYTVVRRPSIDAFRRRGLEGGDPFERHLNEFHETMGDLVRYASPKWPIGVMFTWGFDSSVILAWLAEKGHAARVVPVTAQTGDWTTSDDLEAPKIARNLWFEHRTVKIDAEGWRESLSKNVRCLGDPSEAYGYSMTISSIHDALPEIPVFLNGSWTDSPIASTHVTLSVLWEWWFGSGAAGFHDLTKSFRSILPDGRPYLPELEKTVSDVEAFVADFSDTYGKIMNFTGLSPDMVMCGNVRFSPFSDKYGLSGSRPSVFELLTALDMSGIPHRMSDAYFSIPNARWKESFPPFAAAPMRDSAFAIPVRSKFDPAAYPVTVRDNQYFMKTAFARYVPESLRNRHKTRGSLPNVRFWLASPARYHEAKELLDSFSKRGWLSDSHLGPLLAFYEKYVRAKEKGLVEEGDTARKVTLTLSKVWRICALEIFAREFLDA